VIANGQENTIPLKRQSKAETQVRVASGQTLVIGGLRTGKSNKTTSKSVPILSDIPLLGRLFRNPSRAVKVENLMIFITPTIVGEQTQPEAEQLAQVDDQIARDLRKSEKSSFGQLFGGAVRDKNEILVSIGQSGSIRCDGKQMTLDDLRKRFDAVKVPAAVLVVLRKNARAPEDVVSSVTDLALEKRLRVESDSRLNAFVPDYGAQEEQAGKSQPAQEESKPPENAPTAPATPEPEKPAESAAK